jgi:hypothetical protein
VEDASFTTRGHTAHREDGVGESTGACVTLQAPDA